MPPTAPGTAKALVHLKLRFYDAALGHFVEFEHPFTLAVADLEEMQRLPPAPRRSIVPEALSPAFQLMELATGWCEELRVCGICNSAGEYRGAAGLSVQKPSSETGPWNISCFHVNVCHECSPLLERLFDPVASLPPALQRVVRAMGSARPVKPDDRALITLRFFNGADRSLLNSLSAPLYFPRRMHAPDSDHSARTLHRLMPAIRLFSRHMPTHSSENLNGVVCLSCGDPDTRWYTSSAVMGKEASRGEYRFLCDSTSVAVCEKERKTCLRKARKTCEALLSSSALAGEGVRTVLLCATCAKKKSELGPGAKMKECGGCRVLTYCSRDCQLKDWARHKEECRAAKKK